MAIAWLPHTVFVEGHMTILVCLEFVLQDPDQLYSRRIAKHER